MVIRGLGAWPPGHFEKNKEFWDMQRGGLHKPKKAGYVREINISSTLIIDKINTHSHKPKKLKVQFYSLISSLTTYNLTFILYPLVTGLFQLHGEVRISPEASETFEGEVPCTRTQYRKNVPRLTGRKHAIYLKIMHQAGLETARQARHRQRATL